MLEIQKIESGYAKKIVLQNLSLEVEHGELHGILGWNGAGKTTFFNTIFGFLPTRAGNILLDGRRLEKSDCTLLETDPFFYPNLRGREYLELLGGGKIQKSEIERWQTIFELPLEDLVNGYSTGMLKKLAIAGAFLQQRKVLLLDEPFNGLDLESAEKLSFLLEKMKGSGEQIVLISSHILPTLTRLCDKISRLDGGRIAKTYLPDEFSSLEESLRLAVREKMDLVFE